MPDYTEPQIWDITWSRPYHNYEKHHAFFWQKIRDLASGSIVDLGCGSASCWKDTKGADVAGFDFSPEAITQAKKNCPLGYFFISDITKVFLPAQIAKTVVLCGVVNYYFDITPIMTEAKRLCSLTGKIIVTINVINDFPGRAWDKVRIDKEFSPYGKIEAEFTEKIGWLVIIRP